MARTTRAARRAGECEGADTDGRWMPRLPDTKAGKEWVAPASAGEASMAHFALLCWSLGFVVSDRKSVV